MPSPLPRASSIRRRAPRARTLGALARLAVLGAVLAPARAALAQTIMAAPHAVVVNDRTRTGAVTLVNTSDAPVEVRLSTTYGYPVTDSAGRMTLRTVDAVDDTMPSAAGWVRFFPDRLVVPPQGRRTVRLLVTPPAGLPNGEYWSRVVVAARGAPVSLGGGAPGIAIGLALEVRSVLALFYRQGPVATGVRLDGVRLTREGDSVVVRAHLARQGSAAFLGSLRAVARDSAGVLRAQATLPVGVYYTLDPRLTLPARDLRGGRYQFTVEAVSSRPDVPDGSVVKAPTQRVVVAAALP